MDLLSIVAACVGLLSALTTISMKIRSHTIDAKNTNKELALCKASSTHFKGAWASSMELVLRMITQDIFGRTLTR